MLPPCSILIPTGIMPPSSALNGIVLLAGEWLSVAAAAVRADRRAGWDPLLCTAASLC